RCRCGNGCGGSCRCGSGRGCCACGTDECQDAANLCGLVFRNADFQQDAGHGGGDLGVNLVGGHLEQRLVDLDGVAHGLQPAGDGSFGDGLAQGGQDQLVGIARRSRGRCCCGNLCRGGGGGFCNRRGRLCHGGSFCGGGCRGCCTGADAGQCSAHFRGLVLGHQDFFQDAGEGRRDLGVHLVGGNFQQGLVHFDAVPNLLEPPCDGAFGDAFTQGGQVHGFRHFVPVLLLVRCIRRSCCASNAKSFVNSKFGFQLSAPGADAGCTNADCC